jgi:hypothetical protein
MISVISMVTSCSNMPAPLPDDGLYYCAYILTTLTNLSIININYINIISIQDLGQVLGQSVELAQHPIANPHFTASTILIDSDLLR